MAQDRSFERDAVSVGDLLATLVDVAACCGDHTDVVVGVDPSRDGQAKQLEGRVAVLVRFGVAVCEDRADLDSADTRLEVELHGQRLGDELLLGQVREHLLGIDEDGVAAGRTLVRNAVFVEQIAQQLDLTDAGVELFELRILVQTHCEGIHVASRHAAVGHVSLVHDAERHRLDEELLGAHGHEAAHVHHAVLLGRNGHDVGILIDLADDLLD